MIQVLRDKRKNGKLIFFFFFFCFKHLSSARGPSWQIHSADRHDWRCCLRYGRKNPVNVKGLI